jgi:nicotinate phosphoribosyltransferase
MFLLQGLHEITDKGLTSSDGSNKREDFVSLVQNWLIRIQVPHVTY